MAALARSVARTGPRLNQQYSQIATRTASHTQRRCYANNSFGPQIGPGVGPQNADDGTGEEQSHKQNDGSYNSTAFKMFESAATTFASLAVLA